MAKEQIISSDSSKTLITVFAGLIAAVIVLMCLMLSQGVFAGQSEVPFQVVVRTVPEKELVKSLMTDAPDAVDDIRNVGDSWQVIRMRVTGYCPCSKCCGVYSDGITACNHRIQDGDKFVAADKMYSFGTEMVIPGYNSGQPVKVMDRGGAIKGDRLDAFFHTHQQALEWGVKYLDVRVKIK